MPVSPEVFNALHAKLQEVGIKARPCDVTKKVADLIEKDVPRGAVRVEASVTRRPAAIRIDFKGVADMLEGTHDGHRLRLNEGGVVVEVMSPNIKGGVWRAVPEGQNHNRLAAMIERMVGAIATGR